MSKLYVDEIASKTGGTDALTIDSSGKINAPVLGTLTRNVVSFQATGPSTYTSFGASGVITYNDTSSAGFHDNTGGNYSTTNAEFTCPVAGLYHFQASCLIQTEGALGILLNYRNSSDATISNFHSYNHGRSTQTHCIINMSVGEKIRVLSEDTSAKYIGIYGRFSGFLIG
tara:strand:- start:1077 stop:1589 length:513 start_codon:yes stop_codon:yes gene_type:complete